MDNEMESPQRKLRPDPIITRSQSSAYVRCFDLKPLEKFSGIQLPTNSDVLRRYFSIRDEFENRPKREIAGILGNRWTEQIRLIVRVHRLFQHS